MTPQPGQEDAAASLVTVGPIMPSLISKHVPFNNAVGRVASTTLTGEIVSGLILKGVSHTVCVTNLVGL